MKFEFPRLFDVEIHHHYYTTKISRDFVITPTRACQSLMRDYELLFRTTARGFSVYYAREEMNAGPSHPLKPIEENVKFSFMLRSRKRYLLNFSNLPLDIPSGAIYYMNNLNDNIQQDALLLTADANSEFLTALDAIEFKPLVFQHRFESQNPSAEIEILDEHSNTVIQKTVGAVDGEFNHRVDLRRREPGRYTLYIEGAPEDRFYAGDERIGRDIFALIDIYHHDNVSESYRFTDPLNNHTPLPKTYVVKIDNRKTFWKYYLVLKYRLNDQTPEEWPADWPGNWTIAIPSDPPIAIGPRVDEIRTMADGALATPFVSDVELPMLEKPVKGIRLESSNGNGNSGGIREIENLPNPSAASITPDDSDNKIYSEVFVYV